jgi:hypothetical protein
MFELIRNAVYPCKCNKNVAENPFVQKIATIRLKKVYWDIVGVENFLIEAKAVINWKKFVSKEMKRPKCMFRQRVVLCNDTKLVFNNVMENIRQKLHDKMIIPARKLIEKEQKAKCKKIRRRFRRLVDNTLLADRKTTVKKYFRRKAWDEFLLHKDSIGRKLREKAQ